MIIKNCLICNKKFITYQSRIIINGGKYCSKKCQHKSLIGRPSPKKGIKTGIKPPNIFQKNHIPWNKGMKNFNSQENSPSWKGDNVGYAGVHDWINKRFGKPKYCEFCMTKENRKYAWANISDEYKRDIIDWLRLCYSCHKKFDNSKK